MENESYCCDLALVVSVRLCMSLLDTLAAALKDDWNVANLEATVIIFPLFAFRIFLFCFWHRPSFSVVL